MNALALVIGNNDYLLNKNKLDNAVNDANSISKTLLRLGYVVQKEINCDKSKFAIAISVFTSELEKYDVGLFFFSGHGFQIDGENYLAPIDADFSEIKVAKYTSFPIKQILTDMEKASSKIKIVILDACRNNPFPDTFRGSFLKGLATIYAPKGTIIAFSTSPGETAMDSDGVGGQHSIYTQALLKHIEDKNIQIEDFFKRVRTSVYSLSRGKQLSWEHTSLIGDYYFNSGQLIHALELPYSENVVADSKFVSDGSETALIIEKLKSQNWYDQKSALSKYKRLDKRTVHKDTQFLLGRNLLQTLEGGEFSTIEYFNNLGNNLNEWTIDDENHILNGILFEIYFDSNGKFRQGMNFKSTYINEIYKLELDQRFNSPFDFINTQLLPFRNYLFYIPSKSPVNLAIELRFDKPQNKGDDIVYKLESILFQGADVLEIEEGDSIYYGTRSYEEFTNELSQKLCVPKARLTISTNYDDIEVVKKPKYYKIAPK